MSEMINKEQALAGRDVSIPLPEKHFVNQNPLSPPYPEQLQTAMFGLGCFWGAERKFWQTKGVYITLVGYAAGFTPNPTYQEVCSGMTGHNEVVQVMYDPAQVSYEALLKVFWESHDPTQGMRQGNDRGTQYRSGIYTYSDEQQTLALASKARYQVQLAKASYSQITTEIVKAPEFYPAEEYHQQYLAKLPGGYCGLGGTGIAYQQG
ncbi:MAG: peptide-methionine (S)-S-oxide reductase MsrA [Gammaproteobacteria bacterium]|nr:peptide-methionine (S)-S-oxide reductase MsrA [Gammaproteobacteria bacterium]